MGASFFGVLIITLAESNRYFLLVLGRARRRTAIILSRDVNDWGRAQTAISVAPRWAERALSRVGAVTTTAAITAPPLELPSGILFL